MPDYSQGKIYTIRSHQTDKIYIGSTTQSLKERLRGHKKDYNSWKNGKRNYTSSYEIIIYDDAYIELLEDCSCERKEQLHKREGELIREMDCVNKQVPCRSNKEWREENRDQLLEKKKKYYEDNKIEILEKQREYGINNKEKISERKKLYRENNKEKIAEQRKDFRQENREKIREANKKYLEKNKEEINKRRRERYKKNGRNNTEERKEYDRLYREKNKERIAKKASQKVMCVCGVEMRKDSLTKKKHINSKKHQEYLKSFNNKT